MNTARPRGARSITGSTRSLLNMANTRVTRSRASAALADSTINVSPPATPTAHPASSNRAKRGRISRVNQRTSVPLVDLAITPTSAPRGSVFRGPLQVDLTCELEDEVFVVLEDINPLNRAATITLPITLGSTPTRPLPRSRRGRHGIQRRIGNGDLSSSLQNSEPSSSSLSLDHVLENTSTQAEKAAPVSDAGPSPPNSIRCPICLDSLHQIKNEKQQNMFSTTCGHLFCEPCITQVIASTKQCPTCRQSLTTRKIHPVFI